MPSGVSEFYRLYAARCTDIAQQMTDADHKATFLRMAQQWLVLAHQPDRNGQAPTTIYETPGPGEQPASVNGVGSGVSDC